MKRALIIGISGQDGFYLSQFLRKNNYVVGGIVRNTSDQSAFHSHFSTDELSLFQGNLLEKETILSALHKFSPNEVYNLGAESMVPESWATPERTADVNALGSTRTLEAIRLFDPSIRYYQASSSEMFGFIPSGAKSEQSPLYPSNPYAISKAFAHRLTIAYREHHGMFACSGILFNHESPRRSINFVSRHVTRGVAAIKLGMQKVLPIGNLHAKRDWGDARDYVRAMWLMLQQDQAHDYVIGSGQARSVEDLIKCAFQCVGISNWEDFITITEFLRRSGDDDHIVADSSKARESLGWSPTITFEEMISDMVDNDLNELSQRN